MCLRTSSEIFKKPAMNTEADHVANKMGHGLLGH
jgi:hypothetical protein